MLATSFRKRRPIKQHKLSTTSSSRNRGDPMPHKIVYSLSMPHVEMATVAQSHAGFHRLSAGRSGDCRFEVRH
jgi:hypothetical protein